MKLRFFLLFIVFECLNFAVCSRILFLFPTPSQSHLIVAKGLTTTLAERGHDVTVVSPFPLDKPMKNYRDIKIEIPKEMHSISKDMVQKSDENLFKKLPQFLGGLTTLSNNMIAMPEFQKLMAEEKFDLLIVGWFFNDFLLGFGDHFKCPTIFLSVMDAMTLTNILVGNPLAVTSISHRMFHADVSTFFGRVKNFLFHGSDLAMIAYTSYLQKQNYE